MGTLDKKDQKILALLRDNARISVVEIAKTIKVSRATIQSRINRLETSGVILGYTVEIGSEIERPKVKAITCIQTESKKEAEVISQLRGNPNVTTVHNTTGHWDIIAEVQIDDLTEFNATISDIRLMDGVKETETNLLLNTYS